MTPVRAKPSLHTLSAAEFAASWRRIFGETPATILTNRCEMILQVVESVPPLPLPKDPPWRSAPENAGPARRSPSCPAACAMALEEVADAVSLALTGAVSGHWL